VRTEGWIGLGVSSNGGMRGADIMIVYRKDDRFIIEVRIDQTNACNGDQ